MASLTAWSNFSKRKNSTKIPSGTGTVITCNLKDQVSADAPVFIINSAAFSSGINYVQFRSDYYFVDDVVSLHNNLIELHCSKDVLATYKTQIQGSTQHVLYYNHANSQIADKRLSIKTTQTTAHNTGSFGFLGKNHCFILTIIGKDRTCSFVLTPSQIEALYATDYQTAFDNTIDAIPNVTGADPASAIIDLVRWWKEYLKSAAGAFNYAGTISENIKSCIILPVAAGAIGGTPGVDVVIGGIDTGVDGFKVTDRYFTDTATVTIPWQSVTDWRRLDPYMELYLYIPALGLITLSPSDLVGESSLTVKVSMDVLSGDSIFEVKSSTKTVYYANTNLATQYALGSSQTNKTAAVNSLIAAAGLVTGNPTAALGGALGLANSLKPTPTCIGSNSGGAILGIGADEVTCYSVFHDTTVSPSNLRAVKGEPHNASLSLSGISGYVQTDGASVDIPGFGTDKDRVNNFLNGGIYIE